MATYFIREADKDSFVNYLRISLVVLDYMLELEITVAITSEVAVINIAEVEVVIRIAIVDKDQLLLMVEGIIVAANSFASIVMVAEVAGLTRHLKLGLIDHFAAIGLEIRTLALEACSSF